MRTFYAQCEKIYALAQQSYENIAELHHHPTGTLKISAPPAFGLHLLAKPLAAYRRRYPDVVVNVVLESQIIDLVQQGYDLAIRSAILPDSSLIARKLTDTNYMLCATLRYLQKHGAIDHPEQLAHHQFAVFSTGAAVQKLEFIRGKRQFRIMVEGQFQSNQTDLIMQLVMLDSCIAVLPDFMVTAALAKGKLKACLADYRIPTKPLYLLYAQREFLPLKVKALIDILHEAFAR